MGPEELKKRKDRSTFRSSSKPWRMFCAIEIPENIRQALHQHIEKLRMASTAPASWTKADNIHLTLKFFGSVEQSIIKTLSAALGDATEGISPFAIEVGGSGSFPERGAPKVLWVGVKDRSGNLSKLQASIERECESRGFPKEDRAFHPHLTIARLRSFSEARRLGDEHLTSNFPVMEFQTRELLLIRSELNPAGSRYSIVQRFPFGFCLK